MTKKNCLGVAVIGAGYWGGNYVRLFQSLDRAQLVAVCDASKACLDNQVKRYPHASFKTFTSVDEMLREPDVDAVVVCVPATFHYKVARLCLEAGKHVLCEKPLTTVSKESMELAHFAKERSLVLMVGHTFLFNNGVAKLKELSERPEFGKLYYIYAKRTNLGPVRQDVNAAWDLAPHDISVLLHLMDAKNKRPRWVSATGASPLSTKNVDIVHVSIGFDEGIICNIHCSWIDPGKERQIVVVGSNQKIVFDDVSLLHRVTVYNKGAEMRFSQSEGDYGAFKLHVTDGDTVCPALSPSEPLKVQCEHFIKGVLDEVPIISDAVFGARVVHVLEAIDESILKNGIPVQLD